jgi:hypothetical protein
MFAGLNYDDSKKNYDAITLRLTNGESVQTALLTVTVWSGELHWSVENLVHYERNMYAAAYTQISVSWYMFFV